MQVTSSLDLMVAGVEAGVEFVLSALSVASTSDVQVAEHARQLSHFSAWMKSSPCLSCCTTKRRNDVVTVPVD